MHSLQSINQPWEDETNETPSKIQFTMRMGPQIQRNQETTSSMSWLNAIPSPWKPNDYRFWPEDGFSITG